MGEGVRVKTAITFICEKYFSNQEREVESSFVRFILIHNFQYLFPYFDCVSKKNIYLCRTLSAHQRDGTGRKRFLFPIWSKSVLSLILKNSKLLVVRDDTVDTPRERLYINISVRDVLYIND